MSSRKELTVDAILPHVGEFGRFQLILEILLSIMIIPRTFHLFVVYFAGLSPDWRCVANSTACLLNGTRSKDDSRRCSMPRSDWEYVQGPRYSLQTSFDISCEGEWIIEFNSSIFFVGWSIGAVFMGWAADNYGRRFVLFPSAAMILLTGFVSGFSPNIWFFTLSRFLTGFFFPGTSINILIMASELVGPRFRPTAASVVWFLKPIGLIVLGVKAYYVRDWRTLFTILTVPYVFILSFWFFIPESIRWLHVHGRVDQAMTVLKRVAIFNKRTLPEDIVLAPAQPAAKTKLWDIFQTKKMAIESIAQGYAWMIVILCYYGLSLASKDFGGDLYLNFILVSVVEFPASICSVVFSTWIGRKKTAVPSLLVGSIACAMIALVPAQKSYRLTRLGLGVFGKFLVTICLGVLHIWSLETYPTTLRSMGMGYLQVTSRMGAVSAPFIARSLRRYHQGAPFVTMGILGVTAAIALLVVPETIGKATIETTKDKVNLKTSGKQPEPELEKFCKKSDVEMKAL